MKKILKKKNKIGTKINKQAVDFVIKQIQKYQNLNKQYLLSSFQQNIEGNKFFIKTSNNTNF